MTNPDPSPVIHLELHTANLARACDFYSRVCGWRTERVDAGPRPYQAFDWGDGLAGGVVECGANRALWLPYVEIADVEEATERATRAGASVMFGPREGPAGWRSVLTVPDGGEIAFWQPKDTTPSRAT